MQKKILVCGAGSIGKRHIENLLKLGAEVIVWRKRSELLSEVTRDFSVNICTDLNEGIANVDGVVIATASDEHIEIAKSALQFNRALFIEKPLSHNLIGIDDLKRLAIGKVIEVGYQFRTHPNLIALESEIKKIESNNYLTYRLAMGHRLDEWRPNQNYKQSYSADSSRGGGALFDLSHQIDIALWLFGPVIEAQAVLSKLSGLSISGDDVTNILLTHKTGITGHIQLDMASPVNRCEVEVMTTQAIFQWSNNNGDLKKILSKEEVVINHIPKGFKRNDLFICHMKHWLNRIDNIKIPAICAFQDGLSALELVLDIQKASLLKQAVKIGVVN